MGSSRPTVKVEEPSTPSPRKRTELYSGLLASFGATSSPGSAGRRNNNSDSAAIGHVAEKSPHPQASTPRIKSEFTEDELLDRRHRNVSVGAHQSGNPQGEAISLSKGSVAEEGESVKMEARKKERLDGPRRSTRKKKDDILASDTIKTDKDTKDATRNAAPRANLNTARRRLREGIALSTKAKANNFFVAHQQFFLPLLPPDNYISRLISKGKTSPMEEYTELTEQPHGVRATLKPYQLSGLSFLVHLHNNGFSGILGDEMGLGKTLQTLSLFQYLEERDQANGVQSEEVRPYLVICPLSVLDSWVNEANNWVPDLKILKYHGSVNERIRLKRMAQGLEDAYGNNIRRSRNSPSGEPETERYKIIVTTYEAFQSDQSWFKHSLAWRYVVLDEGHRIKNGGTQIASALRSISAEFRLILTGTPLQNNLVEMWALLCWLYPNVFTRNTETLFKESFDLTRGKINTQTMDDARRLLELIMLRRMKDSPSVNLGLPEKEEVLLYVPLTPMQRFWYTRLLTHVDDAILNEVFCNSQSKEIASIKQEQQEDALATQLENLEDTKSGITGSHNTHLWGDTAAIIKQSIEQEQRQNKGGSKSAWRKLMNLIMQLRKCCSHPYLLPGAMPEIYYPGQHLIRASGKFILLEKLLKHSIFEQGKKVLIFSGFTTSLDFCEDLLELVGDYGQKFKYVRLDGATMRARRNLDIRMFNDKKSDYKVMLLSTRAGGLGINLTSAEDVIFLDEDWNPQITLQAEARAHRIGQTNKVTIYKLCTQGTVEEQMMGRIRKKLYLSTKITESMRNIHGDHRQGVVNGQVKAEDDMPQMDTSQLKSLVRRGARTLSHPEINATEMLSWDLDTMLQKCRDLPSDMSAPTSEIDEEKWLSVMERVECAVFEGKKYQRKLEKDTDASNILPDSIGREDRRIGKHTTVMVDGFAITKELLNCADWEAVPTMAGKDPRLAEPKREKKREIKHEDLCLACNNGDNLMGCRSCPRSFHRACLTDEFQSRITALTGFYCPQHECCECGKKTADAGGLIFRCRWCEYGFCEDHVDWDAVELIGDNLPEFQMLGEDAPPGGFYIKCAYCKGGDDDRKDWIATAEQDFKQEFDLWLQDLGEEQVQLKKEHDEIQQSHDQKIKQEGYMSPGYGSTMGYQDIASPPALTDTSFATPALGESPVSTPNPTTSSRDNAGVKKRPMLIGDDEIDTGEVSKKKLKPDPDALNSEGSPIIIVD
ncbi:hypothetical protein BU24DRAFT_448449 [Aaosphaeria arxii CBS 175.79]|uniref:ISWI chromatin-remodeling complex ATPase ISW2 n=1 Tax=Aaosphaeria arxii CBS 175.79 TaxID=1450172 RepID=A0A6A5Y3H1_9PLEO|nr:uncharacterized protein BU24DRAFT_448449 [Aaosphaeria arxii CBS 175.79]KAF2020095.1 hypothetical protein BU24DRAFT_448449 [Aaosphaeria arxii CBS 175.79]